MSDVCVYVSLEFFILHLCQRVANALFIPHLISVDSLFIEWCRCLSSIFSWMAMGLLSSYIDSLELIIMLRTWMCKLTVCVCCLCTTINKRWMETALETAAIHHFCERSKFTYSKTRWQFLTVSAFVNSGRRRRGIYLIPIELGECRLPHIELMHIE